MKVVILSGKQGSGKTTLQKALVEAWYRKHRKGALVVNFADIIYQMHDEVLKILHQYWPDRGLVKDGPLLQMLGTDWGRKTIDEDIWVKCLRRKIEKVFRESNSPNDLVIIGDCRFINEFHAFPEALRVRLDASRETRKARVSMWRENEMHPSEIGLDNEALNGMFDMYLNTDNTKVDGCVSLVMVALEKESWVQRRKQ